MLDRTDQVVKRLALVVAGIALLMAYGTVGYLLLGFDLIDALFSTVLAVTTLGPPGADLGVGGKLFTASLAMLGVTAFLAAVAMLGAALVEGRFPTLARRRRMQRRIQDLRDHIIVCAYGRVGRTVARELEAEGTPFLVIDSKAELEDQMQSDGVTYLIGDTTSEAVLRRAGIERARALVCAVDSDAENVYIALLARALNPKVFIVARAAEPGSAARLNRAGADRVVSPYVTSGRHMALQAVRPRVVDSLQLREPGDREVRLDELSIDEGSPLAGRTVGEVSGDAVPLVIRRASGQIVANPAATEGLEPGDVLILLGESAALRSVEG